jgi:Amt family ammonium transporter
MAHMVWGKGGLLNAFSGGKVPCFDFAGGTVVHITSGVSALVCALYLGKRLGYPAAPAKPHNLVITLIGACLLWVGWFGFNAGSALAASGLATSAFVATHFGAAAATLGWLAAEWIHNGKPSVLGGLSGAVAGLVAITPASGFVKPFPALLIGACAGVVCFLMVTAVKGKFGYDDSLDAFGVHGVGGILGAILTGVFATKAINSSISFEGLFYSHNFKLLGIQTGSVLVSVVFCGLASFIILGAIKLFTTLRLNRDDEEIGLDLSEHGESGYNLGDIPLGQGIPGITAPHAAPAPHAAINYAKSPELG